MEVQLTVDQEAFLRHAVESGRYLREQDAVSDALAMWEARERRRFEVLASVDQAEASFARGEGRRVATKQESDQLANAIKRRGLERLAAKG